MKLLVCANCNSDLLPNTKFCSHCGQPQTESVLAALKVQPTTQTAQISLALHLQTLGSIFPQHWSPSLEQPMAMALIKTHPYLDQDTFKDYNKSGG